MDQKNVHIAVLAEFQGLARAGGGPLEIDSAVLGEQGHEVIEEPGVIGAGGGGHHQGLLGTGNTGRKEDQTSAKCKNNRLAQ